MLEQLARDVTGWPARAVEFFELLGTTQYLNHVWLANLRTPDLRDTSPLELLGGPFERAAHTADVRHIARGRGKYNIPNVGLFLWRLQAYPVVRAPAIPKAQGFYRFSQLGHDMPLFNPPKTETTITHLAEEINVPGPIRRRDLYDDLEPIPPAQILVCDLSDMPTPPPIWREPPTSKSYRQPDGIPVDLPIRVAVDPALGRLAFPPGQEPTRSVHVSYFYGFSGEVGVGFYDRRQTLAAAPTRGKPAGQPGRVPALRARGGHILHDLGRLLCTAT